MEYFGYSIETDHNGRVVEKGINTSHHRRSIYSKQDVCYIDMAMRQAMCSTACKDIIGAFAVRDGLPLLGTQNGTLPGTDNECETCWGETKEEVLHAEENMVAIASRENISLKGAKLYITRRPCSRCINMVVQAGFTHIYYIFDSEEPDIQHLKRALRAGIRIQRMGQDPSNMLMLNAYLEERNRRKEVLSERVERHRNDTIF